VKTRFQGFCDFKCNLCRYSAARSARATAGRLFAVGAVTSALYALCSTPGRAVAYAVALVMALWAAVFSRPSVAVMEATLPIEEVALVDEEDVVMHDPRGRSRIAKKEEDKTVEAGELAAEWTPEVTPEVSPGNSEKEEEEDVFASGGEEDAAAADEVAAEAAGRASEIARLRGKVVKLREEADRLRRSRGHLAVGGDVIGRCQKIT
jgi:hypothetical protein